MTNTTSNIRQRRGSGVVNGQVHFGKVRAIHFHTNEQLIMIKVWVCVTMAGIMEVCKRDAHPALQHPIGLNCVSGDFRVRLTAFYNQGKVSREGISTLVSLAIRREWVKFWYSFSLISAFRGDFDMPSVIVNCDS